MALETLSSSNDLLNFIIYETFSTTTPNLSSSDNGNSNFLFENALRSPEYNDCIISSAAAMHEDISRSSQQPAGEVATAGDCRNRKNLRVQVQGGGGNRKKRRRMPRVCKNKEEAETQRQTHIVVERNRRKQMNEHLSVLRSLMPASYVQRGDQASIVGGAIEFVKELEHLLQSLETQKFKLSSSQQEEDDEGALLTTTPAITPFSQFFTYPQYTWSQMSNKYPSKSKASIADIEVTLIETHANLRILSRKSPKQLTKLAAGLQALHLTILHLNVTTMESLLLYSISAKVEEGCQLSSVDDIAGAVHHMLRIIEDEAAAAASASSSSCQ